MDLRGIVIVLAMFALAAFFGIAALVSVIAAWRTGNRQRWTPRFMVSVVFGFACLISLYCIPSHRPLADKLDGLVWLWVPPILVLWLLANRYFGRWMRARGAFADPEDGPTPE